MVKNSQRENPFGNADVINWLTFPSLGVSIQTNSFPLARQATAATQLSFLKTRILK